MILTIVIPWYNRQELIELFFSKHKMLFDMNDVEWIVVNDGSNSAVSSKLKDYCEKYNILLLEQRNLGAPSARNNGVRSASGKWVYFLDNDDQLINLSEILKVLPELVDFDVCHLNLESELDSCYYQPSSAGFNYEGLLLNTIWPSTQCYVWKVESFKTLLWRNLLCRQDYDLVQRAISKSFQCSFIPVAMCQFSVMNSDVDRISKKALTVKSFWAHLQIWLNFMRSKNWRVIVLGTKHFVRQLIAIVS